MPNLLRKILGRELVSCGAIVSTTLILAGWSFYQFKPWHHPISWDAFGYYLYLPAILIHADIAITGPWFNELFDLYGPSDTVYQFNYMDDGNRVIKYPIGLAVLWIPFFLIGHVISGVTGALQDGMSRPYLWSMMVGAWIYLLLGLHWTRKTLLTYFPDGITAFALLLVAFATNLMVNTVASPLMPHMFLFTLYAGIIRHTLEWHRSHEWKDLLVISVCIGLATITRYTEAIALLIPLLWGDPFAHKHWQRFWEERKQLIVGGFILFAILMIQMLYWKRVTGSFIYMSYTNAGEGLDLLKPHIREVLFSFRKGVLIYTPLAGLSLLGLIMLKRSAPDAVSAISAYLLLNLYIVSSWTIWWYAESFGNRGLIQSYAALALPLAALLQASAAWKPRSRIAVRTLIGCLAGFTIFQSWQANAGIIHPSRMTREAYFSIFGRTQRPTDLDELLIVQQHHDGSVPIPDLNKYRAVAIDEQDHRMQMENDDASIAGEKLDASKPWNSALGREYSELTNNDHLFARYSIDIFLPEGSPHADCVVVMAMEHDGKRYGDLAYPLSPSEMVPGQWTTISIWYLTPHIRDPEDRLRAFVWLRDTTPVWLGIARLEVFEPLTR